MNFENKLKTTGLEKNVKNYFRKATVIAVILSGITIAFLYTIEIDLIKSTIGATIVLIGTILFYYYYPNIKIIKKQQDFEKHLPFALMDLALMLELEKGFEQSIEIIAKKNYGLISKEFNKIVNASKEKGTEFNNSIKEMAQRIDSLTARRTASKLKQVYSQGGTKRATELREFASEILEEQKIKTISFSSKSSFYSIIFIAISALIPALFQGIILAGSVFLEINIKAIQALAIITVFFPILNIVILVILWQKIPSFLKK